MNKELNFIPAKQWAAEDVQYYDVDLSTARSNKPLEIELGGAQIYVGQLAYNSKFELDGSSEVGNAIISLNEPNAIPIEINKGQHINTGVAFDRIFLRNEAQSGKKMRIFVSTNTDMSPFAASVETTIVTSAGSPLFVSEVEKFKDLTGYTYAERTTAGTTTVLSGAANTAGAEILLGFTGTSGGTSRTAEIEVGGSPICFSYGTSGEHSPMTIERYKVPIGDALTLVCSNTACLAGVWWKDLA